MDRTIIAPYKAEEKELSDKLYKKLEGLMLLFPPTEEFRKCCTSEMFLKPNQTAFFHAMHYLFRLHDPVEFKKRFYWPISDKRSEASFRSSTVEYLKLISDKHQLNWNIKSYLVVLPGGMKFITFLLDLVGFVIQEQVRLREKQLGAETPQSEISELNLKRMQKQNEFFKDYASHYVTEVDTQISNLRNKTQQLKIKLYNVGLVASNCCINKEFLREFDSANKQLFEQKFLKETQNVVLLEQPLNDLKESIEQFQNKATELRKDKSNLKQALQKVLSTVDSPELEETLSSRIDSLDGPTMNSMVTAFKLIIPTIENWLSNVIKNNIALKSDVTSELIDLKTEFQQIESQIVDFQKKYNPAKIKNKETALCSLGSNSPLLLKYVYTPPIKLIVTENISARLPLQDETNMLDRCSNYLALMYTRTARKLNKEHTREQSFELNNTLNRSKIIDPAQVLRSIYKESAEKSVRTKKLQPQQRHNLSLLGLKWKERQQMMFGTEKDGETPATIGKICEPLKIIDNISIHEQHTTVLVKQTPKTPFNSSSGEITRIALSVSYEKSPSTALLKKPSVVKKFQDASLNIQNLSTSPSGRLEPLMPVEELSSLCLEGDNKIRNEPTNTTDVENDANLLNTPIRYPFDESGLHDDAIFNTSDTILNDVL